MLKKGISLVSLFLLISCMALIPAKGALAQGFLNDGFETGLGFWSSAGDVGLTNEYNVISDSQTAFITTDNNGTGIIGPAVGNMCSFLYSGCTPSLSQLRLM